MRGPWVVGALCLVWGCSSPPAKPEADSIKAAEPVPSTPLTPDEAVAAAISPLPAQYRDSATVISVDTAGKTSTVREGKGEMICLAPDLAAKDFHAACYHRSLDPFMARGRELRAAGIKDGEVDSVRFREIRAGTLLMPKEPAALYQYFGGHFDAATGKVIGAQSLYVVYMPFATGKSTGLSEKPTDDGPWLMYPGTPKAHIMLTGKMSSP